MVTLRLRSLLRLEGSARVAAIGLLLFLGLAAPGFAAGCGRPLGYGRVEFTVKTSGIERPALAQIPTAYDGKTRLAVVFDFHGSNSGPTGQFRRSGWSTVAEREGFVAIALQGSLDGQFEGTHAWNVPGVTHGGKLDDERYIKDAIKAVKEMFCIDPTRIYASGYSGGGRMLSQYICNGHPEFAAAGFVMGLRAGYPVERDGVWQPDIASCKPGSPISIIAFSGMKDVTNPFLGGGKPYWQYGGEAALKRWAELDKCEVKGGLITDVSMTELSFKACAGGARITSYLLKENTHDWPSRSVLFRTFGANGKVTSERDATGRMWEFFKNTRLPEETPLTAGDAAGRAG